MGASLMVLQGYMETWKQFQKASPRCVPNSNAEDKQRESIEYRSEPETMSMKLDKHNSDLT